MIEWTSVVNCIAQYAVFERTKEQLQHHFLSIIEANKSFVITEFYLEKFQSISPEIHRCFKWISPKGELWDRVQLIQKNALLSTTELNYIANSIDGFLQLQEVVPTTLFLDSISIDKSFCHSFLKKARLLVEPNGNIHFEKHPLLRALQEKINNVSTELRNKISQLAKSDLFSKSLAFDQFDIINDRFVLAIRSDSYNSQLGQIISKSASGLTLFVEPIEIKALSTLRLEYLIERDAVLNRILTELSNDCFQSSSSILQILDYLRDVDLYLAKSSFAHHYHCSRPVFSPQKTIDIQNFFHPLLSEPVKNDISLSSEHSGIIISGPNTGGKTVSLKSICLVFLLSRMGVFVPASKAQIPYPEDVFYFSHDQQNLNEGLSSFSSETIQYLNLINEIKDGSFVFIDEIFNSTSSEEASALAIALFDELNQRADCKIFVSSHHQMLKTLMHQRNDFLSASVGFDFTKNLPTYKLAYGSPGASLALSIFRNLSLKLGHDFSVYEQATKVLDNKQLEYEALLESVSKKTHELDKLIRQNKSLKQDLDNQKNASEGLLFLERQKVLDHYKEELKLKVKELEAFIEEIKQAPEPSIKKIERRVESHKLELIPTPSAPFIVTDEDNDSPSQNITIGDHYYCSLTKSDVLVLNLNAKKRQAQIKKGALSMWVPISALVPATNNKSKGNQVTVHIDRSPSQSVSYDCRGFRLEEFQTVVYKALEEVLCGDVPFVTIIHGHGDGILKSWIRGHLKGQGDFNWETTDGNDGETIIKLK